MPLKVAFPVRNDLSQIISLMKKIKLSNFYNNNNCRKCNNGNTFKTNVRKKKEICTCCLVYEGKQPNLNSISTS